MPLSPAYLGFLFALVLAMGWGALVLRYLVRGQRACFFCGARSAEHSPDCPWQQANRQTEDESK